MNLLQREETLREYATEAIRTLLNHQQADVWRYINLLRDTIARLERESTAFSNMAASQYGEAVSLADPAIEVDSLSDPAAQAVHFQPDE